MERRRSDPAGVRARRARLRAVACRARSRVDRPPQRLAVLRRRGSAVALHRRVPAGARPPATLLRRLRLVPDAAAVRRDRGPQPGLGAAGDRPPQHGRAAPRRAPLRVRNRGADRGPFLRLLGRDSLDRAPVPGRALRRAGLPPEVHGAHAAAARRAVVRARLPLHRRLARVGVPLPASRGSRLRLAERCRRRGGRRLLDRDQAVERDLPRRARPPAARDAPSQPADLRGRAGACTADAGDLEVPWAGCARGRTGGADSSRGRGRRPARPDPPAEPEQLGSPAPGAAGAAGALPRSRG